MLITTYPDNCVLLEWSDEQQDFWTNDVKNGKPRSHTNTKGVLIVHVCKNYKEAHLLIDYLNKYIRNETSIKNKRMFNTFQINRQIKAVIKFVSAYNKV